MSNTLTVKKGRAAIGRFFRRVSRYDSVTKTAFVVLLAVQVGTISAVLSVLVGAVYLLASKQTRNLLSKYNRMAFIFVLYTAIVAAWYQNLFGLAASVFVALTLVITSTFRERLTRQRLEDAISIIIGYSVFAFFVASLQLVFGWTHHAGRAHSTFVNPVLYSFYASFVIVLCLYRVIHSGRYRMAYVIVAGINILGMLFTGSKMPWIGVVIAIFVVLFLCKEWKFLVAFSGCIVLAALVFLLLRDHGLREFLNMNPIYASQAWRMPLWQDALAGIEARPVFGRGMLGFLQSSVMQTSDYTRFNFYPFDLAATLISLRRVGWELHSHNIAFEFLYSFGIVGTILFLFIGVQKCWYLFRDSGFKISDPVVASVAGCIAFIVVDGIVDAQMVAPQTLFISLFLFSAVGVYRRSATKLKIKN